MEQSVDQCQTALAMWADSVKGGGIMHFARVEKDEAAAHPTLSVWVKPKDQEMLVTLGVEGKWTRVTNRQAHLFMTLITVYSQKHVPGIHMLLTDTELESLGCSFEELEKAGVPVGFAG